MQWNAAAGAGSYEVEYKTTSSSAWLSGGTTASTTLAITSLAGGTLYDWRVRAICGVEFSTYASARFATSSTAVACEMCYVAPGPPPPPPALDYNTSFTAGGVNWNAKVHLPWDYNLTTTNYPAIIFFPGIGEVGTDISLLLTYGPHKYLAAGWNGNVKVDSDSVKFIIISLQPSTAYPHEALINAKIAEAKSKFRINPSKLYLTGLSHGGWCATTYISGDNYGGPYNFASQVSAVVEVQGVKPDDNSPYPNMFDNFANAGGRLLSFEQTLDNRDAPTRVNRMNSTVPNSAIYVQTSFSGGGHCCFDNFYGSSTPPSTFLLDGRTENIYQWMGRN